VKLRVLVTGGSGFIGSHTVDLLLDRGHDVRILDNLQPRVHPHGKPPWLSPGAEFIHGDVTNRVDVARALEGVEAVFHLAAYQDYMTDFSTFIHVNTESAALLFELAVSDRRRYPVRKVVFASSQAVSGEGRYECHAHGAIRPGLRPLEQLRAGQWEVRCPTCGDEMQPLLIDEETVAPHTAYGISKYAIELLADRLGRRYGIPTVCMRYTYVQGPRNSFYNAYSGIARRFALRIRHGLPPIAYEDGRQLRDYVNVLDVARANALVLEREEADFQVFNVGGGRAVTVLEFAHLMLQAFGSELEPAMPGEFRLGDTRHTISDISKLRALGWAPTIPVEQNAREYVDWFRDQPVTAGHLLEAERAMHDSGVVQRVPR
jgi:dTDP-L-rhamnose 4-epimerase